MNTPSDERRFVEIPGTYPFWELDGTLTVSAGFSGSCREVALRIHLPKMAMEIWEQIVDWFYDLSIGCRVIIQYAPGPSGKEAGSRWFDFDGEALDATGVILDYLFEIETGFLDGKTFVE